MVVAGGGAVAAELDVVWVLGSARASVGIQEMLQQNDFCKVIPAALTNPHNFGRHILDRKISQV